MRVADATPQAVATDVRRKGYDETYQTTIFRLLHGRDTDRVPGMIIAFFERVKIQSFLGIVLVAVATAMAGCASTNYSTFEGGRVVEGTGGTKRVVDGIDIWKDGSPPRKFTIIGIVDDVRRQSLIGMIGYEAALVKKAKEAGGDAIMFLDSHSDLVGYCHSGESGTAWTTGSAYGYGNTAYYQGQTTFQSYGSTSSAIRDRVTKVAVIKYVN